MYITFESGAKNCGIGSQRTEMILDNILSTYIFAVKSCLGIRAHSGLALDIQMPKPQSET